MSSLCALATIWPLFLWGSTLLLIAVTALGRRLRQRQIPSPVPWLEFVFDVMISTALAHIALSATCALPAPVSEENISILAPFFLIVHYVLVIWLVLVDLRPSLSPLPSVWPVLFLYSSYLYSRSFIALEQGAVYPILYALPLGHLLFRLKHLPCRFRNLSFASGHSPLLPLFIFLLLLGIATALSAAPGVSVGHFFQSLFFSLLPLVLFQDLTDERAWQAAAVSVILLAGISLVVLAGIRSGLIIHNAGLAAMIRHRLSIPGIGGPNWISRPLATLLPLGVCLMLTLRGRWHKRLWGICALAIFFTILCTQSIKGYSGWIALAFGLGTLVVLLQWPAIEKWWRQRRAGTRWLVVLIGSGLIAAAILVGIRIAIQTSNFSIYSRLYGWRTLFHQVADHPFFGSGPGVRHITAQHGQQVLWEDVGGSSGWLVHSPLSQHFQKLQLGFHAHNLFLELAIGAGLPALAVFFWFLWELARYSFSMLRRTSNRCRVLMAGCGAGIVASLGWGLIDVLEYSPPFFSTPTWILVGLLLAAPQAFKADNGQRTAGKGWPATGEPGTSSGRTKTGSSLFAPGHPRPSVLGQVSWLTLLCLLGIGAVAVPLFGNLHYRQAYTAYQERRWATATEDLMDASRWEPLNADYHGLCGEALINLGHYDQAIGAYERAARLKRGFAPYHGQLGWLYWLRGDLDQAVAHFQKAVALDPCEAWQDGLYASLGLAYVAQGRLEEALPLFKETIELNPQMALAPYWVPVQRAEGVLDVVLDPVYLGGPSTELDKRILSHLGKADYTARLFDPDVALSSSLSFNQVLDAIEADHLAALASGSREAPRLLATLAEAARLVRLYDRAERAYLLFQETFPESAYGFRDLGAFYRAQERLEDAQRVSEQAVEVSPRDTDSWTGLADVYLDTGLRAGAEEALDALYRLKPLDVHLYELQALSHQQAGDWAQAANALHKSLFLWESVPNRLALADLYRQLEQPQRAAEQCVRAAAALVRTWPRLLDPQLWTIGLCLAQSDGDLPQEITSLAREHPSLGNVLLGHTYRAQGQFEQALRAYQAAANARPDEGAPHYFLGEACQALGQPGSAQAEYLQAASLDPLEPLPLLALGRMQWAQGDQGAALETFRAAVEATPGWGQARIALGNALLALGDREGAAKQYQQAQVAAGDLAEGLLCDLAAHLADADVESPAPGHVQNDYFTINGDERRVLFMHPDSRARFAAQVPEGAVLVFDVATAPASWEQPGDGVAFAIYAASDQGTQQLFSTYIDPKHDGAARRWHPYVVDLSGYAGQTVTLTLETGGGPVGDSRFDWAGWGTPRLLKP